MTQILVIEDDVVVCTPMLKLLRAEAFDVLIANDGSTGVQLAQIYEPDLIICDIMMPEFDGYEVLQALRNHPATAAIPFIFLSAKADHIDLRQGMELGADDYLTKPVKRAELLAAIAARLAKRAALTQPYIDEMKRAAQTLGQMAYVDPLTNLPNRISFHAQCQKAIRQAQQAQQLVAVLRFNFQAIGTISMTSGFDDDRLLQAVAERLKQAAANYPIARLAANDFGMLLDDITSEQAIVDVTQRVLATLAAPYLIDGQSVQLPLRVGVAFYPDHGTSPGELLSRTETALHDAAHGTQYQLYTPAMAALATERQLMQCQLSVAISRGELQIQYQPQVNLITGRMIGAEAVLLWHHADRGLVNPRALIAVADDELVCTINQWTLETACKQAKVWQSVASLPIRLAVPVFARQFQQENVVATVAHILQQAELDPEILMLELTETCAMAAVDTAVVKLTALKAIGVQLAIAEFGTGFSSLNYLKRFPLSLLKIDPSLIQSMLTDTNDAAIVKTIIAIGQSLQLKVMAEGVATAAQVNFLRQSGCYATQGALFGAPLSATDLQALLLTDRHFEVNGMS
ncbi:MAG: EAL domain-containing protein [Tildeniella nuda ZEHNDER 1965/U140]|jgi:diguanylate cyclase (GGDEF)-like protein|nr:EAL domain-containing protein [Tildeniella nuda ZEHNDER 1965/U140]